MNNRYEIIAAEMKKYAEKTEKYIADTFGESDDDIKEVEDAMKYSLFAGGKRIRPYLVFSFCRLFGGDDKAALPFAAAIEMIHTFSLIHDDLPCMDNDDMRRGKPTNHKVYGEATALLAGDALALRAFGVCASNECVSPEIALEAVKELSFASSERGMVGGQIMDMYGETHTLSLDNIKKLQGLKTGALIRASAKLGALAAGVDIDDDRMRDAVDYADGIGLAFQIKDDILDVLGDEKILGKPIGSDAENSKNTFVKHMSIEEAQTYAKSVTESAKKKIERYDGCENLLTLADYLLERQA
ncbi:MAG: polyprenyl synthetase family protein [Clostridia bacterium]|nr:polyprenyl synthetase family protein [Clostridia bacterium]